MRTPVLQRVPTTLPPGQRGQAAWHRAMRRHTLRLRRQAARMARMARNHAPPGGRNRQPSYPLASVAGQRLAHPTT